MNTDPRKKVFRILMFLAALILLYRILTRNQEEVQLFQVTGQTMGTVPYLVKYMSTEESFSYSVDSLLIAFNQSLSTYIPESEISRFNRNDTVVFDNNLFYTVLKESKEVYDITSGAFDPTIGPLVNAWGFGPDEPLPSMDTTMIDSLLSYVGFSRIDFNEYYAGKPEGMYLDFSAIAKGYAVDLIGEFMEMRDIQNYMVEIGGEVRTRGKNDQGKTWAIGIEDPLVDRQEQKILAIVQLEDRAVATSGNYRNYYVEEGNLYAHIINPMTGYTSRHNLLSASVFASTCMRADAFATAFMVMGTEKALEVVKQERDLEAILVFRDENGEIKTEITEGILPFVTLDKTQ